MTGIAPNVIVIPPNREQAQAARRQLRVAAYCRVSTDEEEQLNSYEAQQACYTNKIMSNREWAMQMNRGPERLHVSAPSSFG